MGNKKNDIIEINGKRYDAETGVMLSHAETAAHHKPEKSAGREVTRGPSHTGHSLARVPSASKLLMRKGVKKPGPSLKRQIKAQGQIWSDQQALVDNSGEPSGVQTIAEKHLQRAFHVRKSQFVSHFTAPSATTSDQASTAPAPVAPTPKAPDSRVATAHTPQSAKHPETTSEMLERAIRKATAHEQKPLKKPRHGHIKRHAGIIAGASLAVVLIGVIASQNLSGAQMRIAAARAGFTAKLPDYRPAGFSQGQLNYSPGVVATNFHSNSDERSYTLTQQTTHWDNAALRDSFVSPTDPNYETIETAGQVIYIYGNHNATWIKSGIWYIVQTNGALSDHQLVELAASL